MPYYQEALRRDASNSEVNNQLGILAMKDNNWEQAEKYFRTAATRVKANYTRPKNCESLYYLGVVLRESGATAEAQAWDEKVLEKTKINYMAMNELILMHNEKGDKAKAGAGC